MFMSEVVSQSVLCLFKKKLDLSNIIIFMLILLRMWRIILFGVTPLYQTHRCLISTTASYPTPQMMRSFSSAHAPLNVLRAVSFLFQYSSLTSCAAVDALAAMGLQASMLTGGFYVNTLSTTMVQYSSTGMMEERCTLVRRTCKLQDFTPNSIATISPYRLSITSCVKSPMIRVNFYFWSLIVSWTDMAMSVELGIVTLWFRF